MKQRGIIILCLLLSFSLKAATFCVSNGTELQNALDVAEANNQSDEILLTQGGNFIVPSTGFRYESTEAFDLKLIGGHVQNTPGVCTRVSHSALDTVLDGNGTKSVLFIFNVNETMRVQIESLTIANGWDHNIGQASGLSIFLGETPASTAIVRGCAFIGNHYASTTSSAALIALGGRRIVVQDSLFTLNSSNHVGVINLAQSYPFPSPTVPPGVQFINNTVINNDAAPGTQLIAAGLKLTTNEQSAALVANNLFWNNFHGDTPFSTDIEFNGNGTERHVLNNAYTAVLGQPAQFANNVLGIEPVFDANLPWPNFTLDWSSPLINRGLTLNQTIVPPGTPFVNAWSIGTHDVFGSPRQADFAVEIGAFESPVEPWLFRGDFDASDSLWP